GRRRIVDTKVVRSWVSAYLVDNTTGITPTLTTFLTLWSGANPLPAVSNLNVSPTLTRAVSTSAPLDSTSVGPRRTFDIFNRAGTMNVLFDAAGTLDLYPGQA